MLNTDEATSIMEDSGIEVIKLPDLANPDKDLVFIGSKVVWGKMFLGMESISQLKKELNSIPHYNLLKRIIMKYQPHMDKVKIDGKVAYAFIFQEVISRGEKLNRLDKILRQLFFLVRIYMTPLMEPFEYNDR